MSPKRNRKTRLSTRLSFRVAAPSVGGLLTPTRAGFRAAATLWCCLVAGLLGNGPVSPAHGQPTPSATSDGNWRLERHDCPLSSASWSQRERAEVGATRRHVEQFDWVCGHGTEILVAHRLEPCLLISDLSIQVDVRASLPGVQLYVRVVLPEAPADDDGQPMAKWLPGPVAQSAHEWETLAIGADSKTDLPKLLQQHTWGLKSRAGSDVSLTRAYIDRVAVNLYTRPGRARVELAAPIVHGAIAAEQFLPTAPRPRDASLQWASFAQDGRTDAIAQRNGTVIEVAGQLFMPRVIQHNGEPFAYLRSLGFNTVQLPASATDAQLAEARQAGMWLICPPPPSMGLKPLGADYDRVLAWSLGDSLGEREWTGARQRAQELRDFDSRRGRLIVASVASDWSNYGSCCDALFVGQPTMGSNFPLAAYGSWLHACSESIGHAIPLWVDIDTELSARTLRQAAALGGQIPPTPIHHQQTLFAVYEAVSAGGRGIRFRSRQRLDATDPATRLRAMTLTWINRRIDQIAPWAMGGARLGEVPSQTRGLTVTALKTNRAQLLLVQRKTGWEHRITGDHPIETLAVRDVYSGMADRAYSLAEHGLPILSNQAGSGGSVIEVVHCPTSAAIVLTQDPQIVTRLSLPTNDVGQPSLVAQHAELVRQWLAIMQLVEGQLSRLGRSAPTAGSALNDAMGLLRKADELLANGSPASASVFVDQADQRVAVAMRELLAIAYQPFRDHAAAPLLTHVCLLPAHWQLAERMAPSEWQANGLAGGDFESLAQMVEAGWQNVRTTKGPFQTQVELSPDAAWQSPLGLRLVVSSSETLRGLPQQPPLEIISATVRIPAAQMVRLHGYVNVRRPPAGAAAACLIADSLGGEETALRVAETNGWREFVMYRATTEPATIRLNVQLLGPGEVWLDEVTIRTTPLPLLPPRAADAAGN